MSKIIEAIEQDKPGFRAGWVSSIAVDRLLIEKKRQRVPINQRRAVMRELGYDWHPALPNGRVNNPVPYENGKPRLFVKDGSLLANLSTPAEVLRRYIDDQEYSSNLSGDHVSDTY